MRRQGAQHLPSLFGVLVAQYKAVGSAILHQVCAASWRFRPILLIMLVTCCRGSHRAPFRLSMLQKPSHVHLAGHLLQGQPSCTSSGCACLQQPAHPASPHNAAARESPKLDPCLPCTVSLIVF